MRIKPTSEKLLVQIKIVNFKCFWNVYYTKSIAFVHSTLTVNKYIVKYKKFKNLIGIIWPDSAWVNSRAFDDGLLTIYTIFQLSLSIVNNFTRVLHSLVAMGTLSGIEGYEQLFPLTD